MIRWVGNICSNAVLLGRKESGPKCTHFQLVSLLGHVECLEDYPDVIVESYLNRALGRGGTLIFNPSRLLQVRRVDAGQGPFHGEFRDFLAQQLHLFVADLALLACGGNTDKVLQHLRSRLLLQEKGELNGPMQELRHNFDVGFQQVP
jgi:hypothetical protein